MTAVPVWFSPGPDDSEMHVGALGEQETARSYITFTLGDALAQDLRTLELTVLEGEGSFGTEAAAVAACLLEEPVVDDGMLAAEDAPELDCRLRTDGSRDAEGVWTFDLRVFVDAWRDGEVPGIGLRADTESLERSFRAVYQTDATELTWESADAAGPTVTQPTTTAAPGPIDPSAPVVTAPPAPVSSGTGASPPAPVPAAAPTSTTPAEPVPGERNDVGAAAYSGDVATAATPGAGLGMLVFAGAVVPVAWGLRRRELHRRRVAAALRPTLDELRLLGGAVGILALFGAPLLLSETEIFKLGIVLTFAVTAIGLHILVNWAGELSLAHAGMAGLPAFLMARLSEIHGISPLLLLPLAVIIGAALGGLVSLPALRTHGLYVTIVTLAAGVAIDRFFFARDWVTGGHAGSQVATPTLGPLQFTTSKQLYVVLAAIVLLVVLVTWRIYRSKFARALLWIKSDPDAAAMVGIPVARYRIGAYSIAGAMAGLGGGLLAIWVQRITPQSFPLTQSFDYLITVVLAGPGLLMGVFMATGMLEGGRLWISSAGTFIAYAGPIGMILALTRFRGGLNGVGRMIMEKARPLYEATEVQDPGSEEEQATPLREGIPGETLLLATAIVALAAGAFAIGISWYHMGNTDQVWVQMQELVSGGLGGIALVILGTGLIIRHQMVRGQERLLERLQEMFDGEGSRAGTEREISSATSTNRSHLEAVDGQSVEARASRRRRS